MSDPSTDPARSAGERPGLQAGVLVRVLGTFAASVDGHDVGLGGPRQQAVLARVLAGDGDVVSVEQIIEDVWGPTASPAQVASVHAYVSRLRGVLGTAAIRRSTGGYVLGRGAVAVDAQAFAADVARGRQALARGDDAAAAALLESALARWSGPRPFGPLGDIPFLDPLVARLEEQRVAAAEMLADAHVRLGRAGEDVVLLDELAVTDPLRESLTARLVTALYAAGRQADALAAYERCRHALADQLGVDPTPALRSVYAAVLAQEAPSPAAVAGRVLPTNLPPRNQSFVGREVLLDELDRLLDDDRHRPRAVALTGLGGVGKTELAVELAHRRHREGRVAWWIPAEDPAVVATSLADLAAAVGIAHHEREEDARAALWAELDHTPGWVLVFDNVDEPHLVEPYLPAARHGDVIITSRNPAWRRLARPLTLPPLARRESIAYILARSGDDDPGGADELAELVGDLPLALEQACAYVEQTAMPVPDYVRLFRDRHSDLLLHEAGRSGPTVATTWELAFERLGRRSARAAAVLEVMAFLASDAIAVDLLAPLADDELDLQDAVAELLRLSLVDRDRNVLRVHRLVQDVVQARLPESLRLLRLEQAAGLCVLSTGAPVLGDSHAWAAPAAHLISLAGHAEQLGVAPAGLVDSLAELASRYAARALYPAAVQVLEAALRLVRHHGEWEDRVLEGRLLCQLGEAFDAAGRLTEALDLHRHAVALLDNLVEPDDVVLAHAYNRLGHVLNCADDIDGAITAHERALVALRKSGHDDRIPTVLTDLGYTLWAAGRLGPAEQAFRQAREQFEQQGRGDDREWAHATAGLGMVEQDAGRLESAVRHQYTVIDVFTRACGADHPDTAQAFDKLGYALRLQGRVGEAVDAHLRAVRLLERVFGPDDSRVGMALTNLGLANADAGRIEEAVQVQARARVIFEATLGPVHASTLLAARRLAVALAAAGQPDRAAALLDDVMPAAVARVEGNNGELARIAADAIVVYTAAGHAEEARRWRRRVRCAGGAGPA
jgi:DNA-binding SARP family transcriptional activator/tetratricopeptide (TPR) repeat protein